MKKLYSAPIADLIETEMDNVMAGASWNVIIDPDNPDDPPGPGINEPGDHVGEAKPGGVFEFDANWKNQWRLLFFQKCDVVEIIEVSKFYKIFSNYEFNESKVFLELKCNALKSISFSSV